MDPEDGIDRNDTTAGPGAALPPPSFAPPAAPAAPAAPVAPDSPAAPSDDPGAGRRRPRWLLPTVAVVVVAALGVGAWLILAGGDDEADAGDGRAAAIVKIDDSRLELYGADGTTVIDTLDIGEGAFPTPIGSGLLVDAELLGDGLLLVVDTVAGTVEDYRVAEGTTTVQPLGTDLLLAWSSQLDVDAQVVNLLTRDAEDVSELVGLDSRWSQPVFDNDGDAVRMLAIDAEQLATAILPASGVDDAWLLEGAALDLHDGLALRASGDRDDGFEIALVSATGEIGERADADAFPMGGLITSGTTALVVDSDGTLQRFDADDGSLVDDRDLEIGEASFAGVVGPDRLVTGGDAGTVLLDADGKEIARWDAGPDGERRWVGGGGRCMLLSGDDGGPGRGALLIEVETGEQLVELRGTAFPRGDGCSFVGLGSETDQVVVDGVEVDLGGARVRSLDPIGDRALLFDTSGDEPVTTLVDLDGNVIAELGEGIWVLAP